MLQLTRNFGATQKWDTLANFGQPYQFDGWTPDDRGSSMLAVFTRGKQEQYLTARAVEDYMRAISGQLRDDEFFDPPILTQFKGEMVHLYPQEELQQAQDTYLTSKRQVLGNRQDFGASYMGASWVGGSSTITALRAG